MYLWERYLNCDHSWIEDLSRFETTRYTCAKCLTVRIGNE